MRPEPGSGPTNGASLEPLICPNGPHWPAGRAVNVGRLPKQGETLAPLYVSAVSRGAGRENRRRSCSDRTGGREC